MQYMFHTISTSSIYKLIVNRRRRLLHGSSWLLVGEAHVGGVSQLVQVGGAGKVDHGGRAAHEDQRVVPGRVQVLGDHLGAHEAAAVLPSWPDTTTPGTLTPHTIRGGQPPRVNLTWTPIESNEGLFQEFVKLENRG